MSVKLIGAIWDLDIPREQAWVLMAWADHADHQGRNVFPSIGLIAYKTGYSERQVQTITAVLVKKGIMVVEMAGGGRGHPTHYRIELGHVKRKGEETAPFTSERVQSEAERVQSEAERVQSESERVQFEDLKGAVATAPEPFNQLTQPSIEPSVVTPAGVGQIPQGWTDLIDWLRNDLNCRSIVQNYLIPARVALEDDVLIVWTHNCTGADILRRSNFKHRFVREVERSFGRQLTVKILSPSDS